MSLPLLTSIDVISQANAKAKGKRPFFFKDADVERVLAISMAIAMEHAVTRQRLDALERLLEARGLVSQAELDAYLPDPSSEAERSRWMQEYIARVLRIVSQSAEANRGGDELADPSIDPSIEHMIEALRHA